MDNNTLSGSDSTPTTESNQIPWGQVQDSFPGVNAGAFSSWNELNRQAQTDYAISTGAASPASAVSSSHSIHSAPAHVQESIDPSRTLITHVIPNPHSRSLSNSGSIALARASSRQAAAQHPNSFGMARSNTDGPGSSPNLSLDLTGTVPNFMNWQRQNEVNFSPGSGRSSGEIPSLSPMTLSTTQSYFGIQRPHGSSGLATPLYSESDPSNVGFQQQSLPGSQPGSRRTSREEEGDERPRARVKLSRSPPPLMTHLNDNGLFPDETSTQQLPPEFLNSARSLKHNGQFIVKLYSLLLDRRYQHLIEFTPDGSSFTVYDVDALSAEVLPIYFKHSQFASFVRQLNMYGFSKRAPPTTSSRADRDTTRQSWNFTHAFFHRDRPEVVLHIRRKVQGVIVGSEEAKEAAAAPPRVSTRPRRSTAQSVARLMESSEDDDSERFMGAPAQTNSSKVKRSNSGRSRQTSSNTTAMTTPGSVSHRSVPPSPVEWIGNAGASTSRFNVDSRLPPQPLGHTRNTSTDWNRNQVPSVLRPPPAFPQNANPQPGTSPAARFQLPTSSTSQFLLPSATPSSPSFGPTVHPLQPVPNQNFVQSYPSPYSTDPSPPSGRPTPTGLVSSSGSAAGSSDLDAIKEELHGLQEAYKTTWLELVEEKARRSVLEGAMGEMYELIQRTGTGSMLPFTFPHHLFQQPEPAPVQWQ